jgi:inner membrane transporter RhtA
MKQQKSGAYQLMGYLMVGAASLLFGFNGNLSTFLFRAGISPLTLVEFRMLIGGGCLLLALLIGNRKALKLPVRSWPWIVAFGLTLAFVTYTYFEAIKRLPLAIVLVIQFSAAAWITLGNALRFRKMPPLSVLIALALTFSGMVLLTGVWRLSLNGFDSIGLIFTGLALLTFIAYLLLGKRLGQEVPSVTGTTYGAIVAAIFWLCVQPPWQIPQEAWQPQTLGLMSLVGIFGMAIPFTLTVGALQRLDSARVGIACMLELVAGGIIAYFWLAQQLDWLQIVGCACVLVGIVVLQYEQPGEETSERPLA